MHGEVYDTSAHGQMWIIRTIMPQGTRQRPVCPSRRPCQTLLMRHCTGRSSSSSGSTFTLWVIIPLPAHRRHPVPRQRCLPCDPLVALITDNAASTTTRSSSSIGMRIEQRIRRHRRSCCILIVSSSSSTPAANTVFTRLAMMVLQPSESSRHLLLRRHFPLQYLRSGHLNSDSIPPTSSSTRTVRCRRARTCGEAALPVLTAATALRSRLPSSSQPRFLTLARPVLFPTTPLALRPLQVHPCCSRAGAPLREKQAA